MRSALLLVVIACLAGVSPARAGPHSGPTAAVALGDSYISGEAGRWQNNSISVDPGNSGTDRACRPAGSSCQIDKSTVYLGGTDKNGCHRSDVAEVLSARIPVQERINLACSGGVTKNIFRAASGGEVHNGEAPQGDQLLPLAKAKQIKVVLLSIGGNDLGFASIVAACFEGYLAKTGPCHTAQQKTLEPKLAQATRDVAKSIDEIRAVMAQAGYAITDYRLILQTYPSVVPRAAEGRYSEPDPERASNGCPFYDEDLNWARDMASPEIGGVVKAAAASRNAEVLDLRDAFQGHEFCATSAAQATPLAFPARTGSEWGRFLTASTIQQGDLQEAFHPNAFGQLAFADCVSQTLAQAAPGRFACAGAAGRDVMDMALTRVGTIPEAVIVKSAPLLRLRVRRVGRCATFSVTSARVRIRGAVVRYAGRRAKTGLRGTARICGVRRGGRASASKHGYRTASRTLRRA